MASPLLQYDSLDVIGNGSFGIIRKVRRKSDGMVFARKELNFERMTERDRKQIVSEVNILKDLNHEHIVRYVDRYVDRDAGVLYILMEFCGGGDLSGVIKQAQRHGRPIPEDTVWNYFMQILLALNHCHHPQGSGRQSSGGSSDERDRGERRPQILHRDLKPDNVFLDETNTVKLGDFGLSKALAQASFANTYVGTPYYMSPELMQEKAYDSKSDIWSLGCLIYELCALKPPFHEAKTHAELSILIRNGRIPPLPKGYSPALSTVIKAMLNLNPAMRPSAAQLLQHERLDLAFKVSETQKMLNTVKNHKSAIQARERDVCAREAVLAEREGQLNTLTALLTAKDMELGSLRALLATAEEKHQQKVREALMKREEELRQMVLKHEAEVATRMTRREEEIMEAVRKREEEIAGMWAVWERETREGMVRAVEERMSWVKERTEELDREKERTENVRRELERRMEEVEMKAKALASSATANKEKESRSGKNPLEEVKNILAPLARLAEHPALPLPTLDSSLQTPRTNKSSKPPLSAPIFETPINRTAPLPSDFPSAMKGVILTATGEPLATPSPAEVQKLFMETPRVSLNFAKIFDFESDSEAESDGGADTDHEREQGGEGEDGEGYETDTRPSLAATVRAQASAHERRKSLGGLERRTSRAQLKTSGGSASSTSGGEKEDQENTPKQTRPTRLRRPSIRANSGRPSLEGPNATSPSTSAAPTPTSATARTTTSAQRSKSRQRPGTRPPSAASTRPPPPRPASVASTRPASVASTSSSSSHAFNVPAVTVTLSAPVPAKRSPPQYDLSDEENLPSPFLRRVDRDRLTRTKSSSAAFPASSSADALGVCAGNTLRVQTHQQTRTRAPQSHPHPHPHSQPQAPPTQRRSAANLRAMAVVNAANAVQGQTGGGGGGAAGGGVVSSRSAGTLTRAASARAQQTHQQQQPQPQSISAVGAVRSSIVKAQRASEEARRALYPSRA